MKTTTKKHSKCTPVQRNKYNATHKEQARKYYIMGLNLHEISKLMDLIPVRTLEKWQLLEKWTELKQSQNIKTKTLELQEAGKSYKQIAEILQISPPTVWRYLKQAKSINEA